MRIHREGSSAYTAQFVGDMEVDHSLGNLNYLDQASLHYLRNESGFLKEARRTVKDIAYHNEHSLTVASGNTDKVFPIDDVSGLYLSIGKQEQYLMCHPTLKKAWHDGEIERASYNPENPDAIGEDDPLYRNAYNGVVIQNKEGYYSKQYIESIPKDKRLNKRDQLTVLRNHQVINTFITDVFEVSLTGRIDTDDDGNPITVY